MALSHDGYVRPPLVAVEPLPRHLQVWRGRLLAAALSLALLGALAVGRETLATPAQDPGVARGPAAESTPTAPSPTGRG